MGVPPWGWGTGLLGRGSRRPGGSQEKELPQTGDIEDDVMRVWAKDRWQPPALLLENFRGRG